MLKCCFHLHTAEDPHDLIGYSAKEAIDYGAKLNFDVISITCHNGVIYDKELIKYAKNKNILLIPGIEKDFNGHKHVLILNADKDAENIHTFEELRQLKPRKPYFVIAPHPFFIHPECVGKLLFKYADLFDAIEFSYFYSPFLNRNKSGLAAAEKLNLPVIGTSDIHLLKHFDRTYSLIDAEKNIPSIFNAIRQNKTKIISTPFSTFGLFKVLFDLELSSLQLASQHRHNFKKYLKKKSAKISKKQ